MTRAREDGTDSQVISSTHIAMNIVAVRGGGEEEAQIMMGAIHYQYSDEQIGS